MRACTHEQRASPSRVPTHGRFSVVQLNTSGQTTLCKQAELGDDELVKLAPNG
jgi:hypothetical protein